MKSYKLSPSVLFLLTFGLGLFLSWIAPWNLFPYLEKTTMQTTGIVLLLISLALNALAYKAFKHSLTPHAPFMKPKTLIRHGIFSLSRNPVYLALVLSQGALAFVLDSLWLFFTAMVLWITLDTLIVKDEEKILDATFRQDYTDYKKTTRRWV